MKALKKRVASKVGTVVKVTKGNAFF